MKPKLIDAEALWEDLGERVGKGEVSLDIVYEAIKAAPTVDAAPVVHARWINPDPLDEWEVSRCSNCGALCVDFGTIPYCQHCGAKMDLEKAKP